MNTLYNKLRDFFGEDNVKINGEHIRVRPVWISGAGAGYQPSICDMIETVDGVLKQNADICKFERSFNHVVSEYPVYSIIINERPAGMLTVHHDIFF